MREWIVTLQHEIKVEAESVTQAVDRAKNALGLHMQGSPARAEISLVGINAHARCEGEVK